MNKKGLILIGFTQWGNLTLTAKAIHHGFELHKGQKRNDGKDYIEHSFDTCLILINNGIKDDVTLAASILHDTGEDTNATHKYLAQLFGAEVANLVSSVTKKKGVSLATYFAQITDPREVLIKTADRMHNMNDMAKCFTTERLEKYIKETEKYILPMIKKTRKEHPEYASPLLSMKANIDGILVAAKRIVKVEKKCESVIKKRGRK